MADMVEANQALEERLDKQRSRLYKLENLNIPHQVSKAVDEIVTDAVDWAIQAPLRDRFRDLTEADMKEILHHRMWESNFYQAHEDHKMLYEAMEKSMARDHTDQLLTDLAEARRKKKKRRDSPKTPPGSPPHQPPPPPPPAVASAEYTAWTTIDTRLKPPVLSIPEELHMDDDTLQLNIRLNYKDGHKYTGASALASNPLTSSSELGPEYEIVKGFHPNCEFFFVPNGEGRNLLTFKVDDRHSSGQHCPSRRWRGYYPDVGLEHMVPDQLWIEEECKYDIAAIAVRTHMRIISVVRIEVFSLYGSPEPSTTRMIRDSPLLLVKLWTEKLGHKDQMDKYGVQMIMRFNEIHKFSDDTLQQIDEALDYQVKEFKVDSKNLLDRVSVKERLKADNTISDIDVIGYGMLDWNCTEMAMAAFESQLHRTKMKERKKKMKYSALLKTLKCNVMLFGYELAGQNLSPPRIVYATRGALSRIETGPRYPNSEKQTFENRGYQEVGEADMGQSNPSGWVDVHFYRLESITMMKFFLLLSLALIHPSESLGFFDVLWFGSTHGVVDSWYLRLEFDVLKRNVHMEVDLQPSVDVEVLCCVMLLTFIGIISSMYSGRTLTTGDFHE
ncbi:hypothetical protein Tco_0764519 [Tanacetum coccineum]